MSRFAPSLAPATTARLPPRDSTGFCLPTLSIRPHQGVPHGRVEPREFLDPCKAVTSLQIARDVRTSSAVEVSTALSQLPEDVLEAAAELADGRRSALDVSQVNDYSVRIPSSLLDLDVDEELSGLRMFQDIVSRQKLAREKLLHLLLKSRCQFGSVEAARDYDQMGSVVLEKLKKRKQLLGDALELEGLDPTQIIAADDGHGEKAKSRKQRRGGDSEEEPLPPLAWYRPEGGAARTAEEAAAEGEKE